MISHYETMGVGHDFEPAELTAMWRKLSREMHPDRLGGTREANAAFACVTEAYAVLSDPKRRKVYDILLDVGRKPCKVCQGSGYVFKRVGYSKKERLVCDACKGTG